MDTSTEVDAGETRRVSKLRGKITESRKLRTLVRDPDLQAVESERHRRCTLAGLWFFLGLGLVFTTTGVQQFLAGDATRHDPVWWAAWTVEPMFAGLLIVLLNFEATILAHGVDPDSVWLQRLKRILLASTVFMNVYPQITPLWSGRAFNLGSAVVHAIIPIIVFCLAEVIPVIQARIRTVILNGYAAADRHEQQQARQTVPQHRAATPEHAEPTAEQAGPKGSVKLPAQMAEAIHQARTQAASEGREFTADDVQQVVKVPAAMAQRIVADLAVTNGHPVAGS